MAIIGAGFLRIGTAGAGAQWVQYSNNFEGSIGPEWSAIRTATTPVGGRAFLGQFGAETVTLTLSGLRAHTVLGLSFDLFIIGSWDGNYVSPGTGPDIWDLSVLSAQTVLHTTFNTHTFAGQYQAYPGSYPGGQYPSNTGAAEVGTLGYSCFGSCTDAVYHLDLSLYHAKDSILLIFSAPNLEAISNESWGLDNVLVWVESPPPDFDQDGDVDEWDIAYLDLCSQGPGMPIRTFPGCETTDLDGDDDVDMNDFGLLQRCYGGEHNPADPNCGD